MAKILYNFAIIPLVPCKDPAELFRDFLRKEDGKLYLDFEKLAPRPPDLEAVIKRSQCQSNDPQVLALQEEDRRRWESRHGISDELIWVTQHWGCRGPSYPVEITRLGLLTAADDGPAVPIVAELSKQLHVALRLIWCLKEDCSCAGFIDIEPSGTLTETFFDMPDTPVWILEALGYSNLLLDHYREIQAL